MIDYVNKKLVLYRGATYNLPVKLKLKNGEYLPLDNIKSIKFSFGGEIIKEYPSINSDITIDDGMLIVHLSSEDTSSLPQLEVQRFQACITFVDGSIKFTKPKTYCVSDTQFKRRDV